MSEAAPPNATVDRSAMLRVDQAGEYGATRIYAGQLAVMGNRTPRAAEIAAMAAQEAAALVGPETAMACTAAVEEEIDRHYTRQLETLGDSDPELSDMIEEFRTDERAHRDAALAAGAERAPAYPLVSAAIRLGCRVAIRLSERI